MAIELNKNLIKGSIILLISYNIYNALNFFFHFFMVRLLSINEYGILAALYSIIYMLAVFTESIQTVITKYTTKEKNKGKLKNILKRSYKKTFLVSMGIFIFYLILAMPLSFLLKIDYALMGLNGLMIFLAFLPPVSRGVLQGSKRFKTLGINMISEATIKLILAIIFVIIGLSVFGAILGTLLGVTIALILSFIPLRDIIRSKEIKADTVDIYGYTKPAFFIMLVILTFYSIDIVVAKIFFEDDVAGYYAIASILAKTIFFGTQPISRAMFPLAAENSIDKKKSNNIFANALSILFIAIFLALSVFYFFPEFIISIFSGKQIQEAAAIIFYLGIAFSLISLANLVLLYKLSLGKVKGYFYLFIFILVEIVLLSLFNSNLFEFSIAFITASAAFLWASIVLIKD